MFLEERKRKIAVMLDEKSSIKVNEIAEVFNVSESTIRRDLREMEGNGLLSRTHGGAVAIASTSFEASYEEKEVEMHEEKVIIGKTAAASFEREGVEIIIHK